MKKKGKLANSILRFFKLVYLKLFRINDTPQKIAMGLGLGVFLGVMPGTGPLAALLFAFILNINRASALLGSILTNTWLSIPTFLLSIKIGAAILGLNYADIYKEWTALVSNFRLATLFKLSIYKVILPIMVGYLIVSLFIGILAYLAVLILIKVIRHKRAIKINRKNLHS